MATKGYFIITDISGYTTYLTQSELEHAHDILQSLFDVQLKNIDFPLKISGFRGDAILIYTPETCFVNPQSFLEVLENLYIVFSETLRQMQLNTTCTCNACKNIKNLDLKMCIHYGQYILQKLGDREELLGADVIVPHRMLKNHVIEKTGIKAYALFSETAAESLNLQMLCEPLTPHVESFESIGEIKMLVHDLRVAWEREQKRIKHLVDPETAWITIEADIPFPPSIIWDYITSPELEGPILGLDYVKRIDDIGGRTQNESRFHCAHSSGDFYNKIIDWKPFEYYTTLQTINTGMEYFRTIRLVPIGSETHLLLHISEPTITPPEGFREFLNTAAKAGYQNLSAAIQREVDSGKIIIQKEGN